MILLLKYKDVYDMPLVVFNQIRRVVGIVCDVIQQTAHPRNLDFLYTSVQQKNHNRRFWGIPEEKKKTKKLERGELLLCLFE